LASIANAAEYLDISTKTARRRIADGTITAYRVGRLLKVDLNQLEALLEPIPTAGSTPSRSARGGIAA